MDKKEIAWLVREKYHGKLTDAAKKDIERIEKGELVDYVIGFGDFLGCRIDLSLRPFIPEEETAFWVSEAIKEIQESGQKKITCLDVFAGSGAIGIAILRHIPFAYVDFTEKQKKILRQIEVNTIINEIDSFRYRIIQSDVFEKIRIAYDYIFANPPYLARARIDDVQKSVLDWEPHDALFGGEDGLDFIKILLSEAKKYLNKDGVLYFEFDSWQKNVIEKLFKQYEWKEYEFRKDQFNKWRWVRAEMN